MSDTTNLNTAAPAQAHEDGVLAALRAATAERHTLLDSGMPLAAADPTLADYRRHLAMLEAWLLPIERWLARHDDGPQAPALFAPTTRGDLIAADLADAPAARDGIPAIDTAWLEQAPADAAYRWGVCYVIEGSQLGGAVLYKRLAGPLAPHPLRYLRGDGHGPGARWRQFMQEMDAQVRSPSDIRSACAGACDAFDALLALMAPESPVLLRA